MALVSLIKNTPNVFMLLKCYFKGGARGCVKKLGGGKTHFLQGERIGDQSKLAELTILRGEGDHKNITEPYLS